MATLTCKGNTDCQMSMKIKQDILELGFPNSESHDTHENENLCMIHCSKLKGTWGSIWGLGKKVIPFSLYYTK